MVEGQTKRVFGGCVGGGNKHQRGTTRRVDGLLLLFLLKVSISTKQIKCHRCELTMVIVNDIFLLIKIRQQLNKHAFANSSATRKHFSQKTMSESKSYCAVKMNTVTLVRGRFHPNQCDQTVSLSFNCQQSQENISLCARPRRDHTAKATCWNLGHTCAIMRLHYRWWCSPNRPWIYLRRLTSTVIEVAEGDRL